MARIYKGALVVIEANNLTSDQVAQITGTGSGRAIKAEDVRRYVAGVELEKNGDAEPAKPTPRKRTTKKQRRVAEPKVAKGPSTQDVIKDGLLAGKTYDAIAKDLARLFPDKQVANPKKVPGFISWTRNNERRKDSDWWSDFVAKYPLVASQGMLWSQIVEAGPGATSLHEG